MCVCNWRGLKEKYKTHSIQEPGAIDFQGFVELILHQWELQFPYQFVEVPSTVLSARQALQKYQL